MGRQVAVSVLPFGCRLRTSRAVPARLKLAGTAASLARFDDHMALAAVVRATGGRHERTFHSLSDRLTNHGNHPLSNKNAGSKKTRYFNGKYQALMSRKNSWRYIRKGFHLVKIKTLRAFICGGFAAGFLTGFHHGDAKGSA